MFGLGPFPKTPNFICANIKQMKNLETNQEHLHSRVSWLRDTRHPQSATVEDQSIRHRQWLALWLSLVCHEGCFSLCFLAGLSPIAVRSPSCFSSVRSRTTPEDIGHVWQKDGCHHYEHKKYYLLQVFEMWCTLEGHRWRMRDDMNTFMCMYAMYMYLLF